MTWKTNISTSLTAPYRFFSYGVKSQESACRMSCITPRSQLVVIPIEIKLDFSLNMNTPPIAEITSVS